MDRYEGDEVTYGSWFHYTLDMERAVLAEPERFHMVHFENLKKNGEEEIRKIARFLNIPADDNLIAAIKEQCGFQSLAGNKEMPETGRVKNNFSIFRKGEIGDWKNHFTVAESNAFDKLFREKMASSSLQFQFTKHNKL